MRTSRDYPLDPVNDLPLDLAEQVRRGLDHLVAARPHELPEERSDHLLALRIHVVHLREDGSDLGEAHGRELVEILHPGFLED